MTNALIGFSGFVGGYIHRTFPNSSLFNSSNSEDLIGQTFHNIFCAGVSAVKWKAQQEPEQDWLNIDRLLKNLEAVRCTGTFILISTIDVYGEHVGAHLSEKDTPCPGAQYSYGIHRATFETRVRSLFPRVLVLRLPGLFGFGLKKNVIYDFVYDQLKGIDRQSQYQWYDLEWLCQDIGQLLDSQKTGTVNLFPEPIPNSELIALLKTFKHVNEFDHVKSVMYDSCTIHADNGTSYWRSKNAALQALARYLNNMLRNNVLVSNLCSAQPQLNPSVLRKFGISKIEVAPWKHFGPNFIERPLISFQKDPHIYSFQALFYPHQWIIPKHYSEICEYLFKLIDIAYKVGVQVLVFGAPKLRSGFTNSTALKFFREVADYIGQRNVTLCIEPNAREYGCSFLTTTRETYDFVSQLNRPQIQMMLDTGCARMENEDPISLFEDCIASLKHIHFSMPHLKPLRDEGHFAYLRHYLAQLKFSGKITIEMLNTKPQELEESLALVLRPVTVNVIGGGWYGCHAAQYLLSLGLNPLLLEQRSQLFQGVSYHNQNRLHMGLHYPRSFKTRHLCQESYQKFKDSYGHLVTFFNQNYYLIANESLIDSVTFAQIMAATGIPLTDMTVPKFLDIQGCEKKCFEIQEGCINRDAAKRYFETRLKRMCRMKREIKDTTFLKADLVIDCTYNNLGIILSQQTKLVYTTVLIYQALPHVPIHALTIMDGPFWSLFPLDITKRFFTLTHVTLGCSTSSGEKTELIQSRMEQDVLRYIPKFRSNFTFIDSFQVAKHKLHSACDSRHLIHKRKSNLLSLQCGKIGGIFEMESLLGESYKVVA